MDLNFRSNLDTVSFDTFEQKEMVRKFIGQVYLYMTAALLISGVIAYQFGTWEFIEKYYIHMTPKGPELSPLYWVVILSPIGVGMALQFLVNRLPFALLFLLFLVYAVLIGLSLSTIFVVYTSSSIFLIFGITAGTFAVMAILGFTTKVDLTRMGSILGMAFLGIFVASIVNIWLGSSGMSWLISLIGAVIFPGLIAFHMQQLKLYARDSELSVEQKSKMALLGGFTLYVLFVNLFLSLLRLFGDRE